MLDLNYSGSAVRYIHLYHNTEIICMYSITLITYFHNVQILQRYELLLHLCELEVYSHNELTLLIKQKERKSK